MKPVNLPQNSLPFLPFFLFCFSLFWGGSLCFPLTKKARHLFICFAGVLIPAKEREPEDMAVVVKTVAVDPILVGR